MVWHYDSKSWIIFNIKEQVWWWIHLTNYIYLIKTRLFATSKLLMLNLLRAIVSCKRNDPIINQNWKILNTSQRGTSKASEITTNEVDWKVLNRCRLKLNGRKDSNRFIFLIICPWQTVTDNHRVFGHSYVGYNYLQNHLQRFNNTPNLFLRKFEHIYYNSRLQLLL